jgi:hypothetical protein
MEGGTYKKDSELLFIVLEANAFQYMHFDLAI